MNLRYPFRALILSIALLSLPLRAAPAQANALPGQTVTIAVTVDGTAPFSYQWYFGANAVPAPAGVAASLVLTNVTAANAGAYHVVVTNAAGSATSDTATLTVATPPTIRSIGFTVTSPNSTAGVPKAVGMTVAVAPTGAPTRATVTAPRGLPVTIARAP